MLAGVCLAPSRRLARILLKNICRVKGQEENTLHGLGLVVGLKGTGRRRRLSADDPRPVDGVATDGQHPFDKRNNSASKTPRTWPWSWSPPRFRRPEPGKGDKIDCVVSSIGSAKSLAGGTLFMTPLQGPECRSRFAGQHGPVRAVGQQASSPLPRACCTSTASPPTVARIHQGCRLEEDFFNVFSKDGKITLVLDKDHADFQVAQDIAELVNSQLNFQSQEGYLARALNAVNIEVTIPQQYRDDPVLFISQVLSLPTLEPHAEARVVINEKNGSVVIGGDVEIGSVVVTHKNIVVETGDNTAASRFVPLDPERQLARPSSSRWSNRSMPSKCRPKTSSTSSKGWSETANCTAR